MTAIAIGGSLAAGFARDAILQRHREPTGNDVFVEVCPMKKVLSFVGATVGGAIGWWLGAFVGTMTAFLVSIVGTAAGVYAALRIADTYLP